MLAGTAGPQAFEAFCDERERWAGPGRRVMTDGPPEAAAVITAPERAPKPKQAQEWVTARYHPLDLFRRS